MAVLNVSQTTSPTRSNAGSLAGPVAGVLTAVLAVLGLWLALGPGQRPWHGLMEDNVLNNAIDGVVLGVIAAVLLALRPGNRIGYLILFCAVVNAVSIAGEGWTLAGFHHDLPGRTVAAWLGSWVWVTALPLGATVLPAIYPTGRAVGAFGRMVVRVGWTGSVLAGASVAMLDDAYRSVAPGRALGHNPVSGGRGEAAFVAIAVLAAVVEIVLVVVTFVWTLRRLRRAASPEREQLAWLVVSVMPILVGVAAGNAVVTFVLTVITSATLVIGIVRHQLFDIKLVLRSGLVYTVLTVVAVGVYFAVVALITTMTPQGTVPTLFALATVGLVVVPAHRVLQRSVGRLVYGDRGDPLRALSRVAEGLRVVDSEDPTGMRPMLAGIAAALRSPYVALQGPDGGPLGAVGSWAAHPLHSVPLEYAGEPVGELVVAGRTPRDPLGPADRRLLAALSGPVAAAVRATLAARELAASRSRVLAARESERRRLREDLHDGLGPSLSGVALGLEAARRSLPGRQDRLPEILEVLHQEVHSLVTEVRGIIDDLGPAEVDLMAALRRQVEAIEATGRIAVELCQDGPVDHAPGEVGVAAQRIVGEALTNAVRHADARSIRVAVTGSADRIAIEVTDDGVGAVAPRSGGVGLSSMRQRAESVGGVLTIDARPGVGTRVHALLPLQALS